jgi:hypothetical protein
VARKAEKGFDTNRNGVTAAGPFPIFTGFPIMPVGTLMERLIPALAGFVNVREASRKSSLTSVGKSAVGEFSH